MTATASCPRLPCSTPLGVVVDAVIAPDNLAVELILELRHPLVTKVMTSVTGLGSATAAVVLLGLFYLADWREPFLVSLVALVVSGVVVGTLMLTVQRPFPPSPVCVTDGAETVASSFPSGHAAAVTVFALATRRSEVLPFGVATLLAAIVAFSRIYLGTHYLSDTVVGVCIGALAVLVATAALRRYDLAARFEAA